MPVSPVTPQRPNPLNTPILESDEAAAPRPIVALLARHWQKALAGIVWCVVLLGFVAYMRLNNLSLSDALGHIVQILQTPYGVLLFLLLFLLRPLAFPSISIFAALSGMLFGPLVGLGCTVVGCGASASLAYLVGRFLGSGMLENEQSLSLVQRYTRQMRRNTFETVLIMHALFFPFDLTSYLGGFLRVHYRPFILATLLGWFPIGFTYTMLGTSLQFSGELSFDSFHLQFNPWTLLASALLLITGLGVARYLKRQTAALPDETL